MSTKRISLAIVLALFLLMPAFGCTAPTVQQTLLKDTTAQIQKAVQTALDNLDRDMSAAASQISRTGLSGTDTRTILDGLVTKYPFIIDAITTDAPGIMVTVAPDSYASYEGTDISQQDVTIKFNESKKPMLSQMFTAVEDMDAVVLMWPIISDKGDFMGSLSALFIPETLFTAVSEPALQGTGISMNVIQTDGLNIYDSEGYDTGKNLFTDPSFQPYPELIAVGHQMITGKPGCGSYTFLDNSTGKVVKKDSAWATVKLHDTAWPMLFIKNVAE